ncbi:MarR family winged helix-turn-helix transcriptional regulator [Actimicrobium antarcticum]|uniref:MarR family winged helix-turn-helix transcriptional regulator n=2 Tax=Actimicrobium antarcticum TaxID=1051899 RepID=A0ABP7T724_9BURK
MVAMSDAPSFVAKSDSLRILQSMRRIAQRVEQHSKHLNTTHDITSPQLIALLAIAQLGPSTLKSIGLAIHLSPSTVVGIVDRLEEKKLAIRTRDALDRRNVFVALTVEGQLLADDAPSAMPPGFVSALHAMPEEDRLALMAMLEKFAALLEV